MNHEILKGKRGIIFGALDENSIAWHVAEAVQKAKGSFTLTNSPAGIRMGKTIRLSRQLKALLIPADATKTDDLKDLLIKSMAHLGGRIDFILHAVGMSPNVRKRKPYTALDYKYLEQTLDISAVSLHKLLQTAWELDALSSQASVVALTYIASQKVIPGYGDMADAKNMLESIARNFGYYYGKRKGVRINTVSQSPTRTTAGSGIEGFEKFFEYSNNLSPLGNADAQSCADFCVMLFSDYARMITMQNLYHDGGFSSTGMPDDLFVSE